MDAIEPVDVLLWGATGFTGRLVARRLDEVAAEDGLSWALGGRDRGRLEALRSELSGDPPIVVADAADPASLDAAVGNARVVASTVGPFARYGTPLVEACIRHGRDYCDITGETDWIRENVDRLHDDAVAAGSRIVHCCGFDSIPSDLGVLMLHDHLVQRGSALGEAHLRVARIEGGFSGGTVTSILDLLERAAADPGQRRVLGDPYSLNPPGEREGPDRRDVNAARHDPVSGRWIAPFVMAAINTRIVRRSNALLGYPYGRGFRYDEAVLARSPFAARVAAAGTAAFALGGWWTPTRWLLRRLLPSPGEGPSAARREAGMFEMRLWGRPAEPDGPWVRGRVRGEHDPGYGETSRMLAAAAACLARDELPATGGILTPASAMGDALIRRLRGAGMTFEVDASDE